MVGHISLICICDGCDRREETKDLGELGLEKLGISNVGWKRRRRVSMQIRRMSPTGILGSHGDWRFLAVLVILATYGVAQQTASPQDSGTASADLASMDLEQLMDLKVTTASLFSDKLSQAPGIMSVVTGDELRRFGGLTLGEILDRVPGLTQSSQYFTDRSLIAADGDQTKTSGAHILFLINGRPTREVMEGGIISDLLESFPVEILERIEIIRGPGSVLYGSNAFSAVINLITRKANGNEASIHGLAGPNGALSSSGHFLYQRGEFSMVGASQIHQAPNWNFIYLVPPPLQDNPDAPPEPPFHDVTMVDRGTGDYLGMNYKGFSFMSAFTEWQTTAFVQGAVGETRQTRDFADLGYEHKVRANWDMNFNTTFTRTTFETFAYPYTDRDSHEIVAEWTNLITLTSKDRLTAGMLFNRIGGIEVASIDHYAEDAGGSRPAGGFYAQLDHQLLPTVKLIGGFQSNKFAGIPLSTVPRAGVIWSPSQTVSVKALYGEAFRPPSLDETTLNLPDIHGNPRLVPEIVETLDLGLTLQYTHLQLGADYFHNHQIHSIITVGEAPIVYENLGGVVFDGVVAEGKYYFRSDFFAQGSFLFQTNHDQTGASNVTPIPNYGFKSGVSYESSRGLVFGLFDVSDGKAKPYVYNVNPLTGWRHSLNAEARQDISRFLHLPEKNTIAIAAHANDLLNQGVWLPGFGFFNIDSIPVQQGRTVYAGLEFSRGKH
jgi:outer membrane receptor protein involved in Fe transport